MTSEYRKLIPERKRARLTGKGKLPPFVGLPRRVLDSEEFGALSAHGTKLAIELARQYRGNNNGDLSAAWGDMRKRGWHSPGTLDRAKRELIETGFAIVTRQGGRNHVCTLFALTWWAIDECKGKHMEPPTHAPTDRWRKQKG